MAWLASPRRVSGERPPHRDLGAGGNASASEGGEAEGLTSAKAACSVGSYTRKEAGDADAGRQERASQRDTTRARAPARK